MHTREISINGFAARMHFNPDFSGRVLIKGPDHDLEIPGEVVRALREDALESAREAVRELAAVLGLDVAP